MPDEKGLIFTEAGKPVVPKTNQALIQHGMAADTLGSLNPAVLYRASLKSHNSRKTMRLVLDNIARILDYQDHYDMPWEKLDRHHVFMILGGLTENGRAANTCNLYLSAIKGVVGEAFAAGQIKAEQYQRIKTIKRAKSSRLPAGRALPIKEVTQLMEHCLKRDGLTGLRDAAMLALLFGCGPRRAEVASINLQDINYKDRSIEIIGKGDRQRDLELPQRTWQILQLWLEALAETEPNGGEAIPLFRGVDRWDNISKSRISPSTIYAAVKKRTSEAGLEHASPHDLRRSFATYLLEKDEDLSTVASMMGHQSLDTTRIYLRNAKKMNQRAAAKIDF